MSEKTRESLAFDNYLQGLKSIIQGDTNRAIDLLTQTVQQDSGLSDAYFQLANLFRQTGEVRRAQKIFRDLLYRESLNSIFREKVEQSLIELYLITKDFDEANILATDRVKRMPDSAADRLQLTLILERQNNFEAAKENWVVYAKRAGISPNHKLALYQVEEVGLQPDLPPAQKILLFKKAIKLDPKCAPAYIQLARLYRSEKTEKKVLEVWSELLNLVPEKSPWIFQEMENYLYEINRYHELLGIYQKLSRKDGPHRMATHLALARHYHKIGEKDKAHEIMVKLQETSQDKDKALKELIRYYLEVDKNDETLTKIHSLLGEYANANLFTCANCGATSRVTVWHCSDCGAWESYIY